MRLTITIETDEAAENVANKLADTLARLTGVEPSQSDAGWGPSIAGLNPPREEPPKRKRRTKAEIAADEAAAEATAAPPAAAPPAAAPPTAAPPTAAPPTAAPGLTLDSMRAAIGGLLTADAGKRSAVTAALAKHGASNLSSLPAEHYADVLIDLGLST